MDCSPPGFSVHVILQARVVEWVAISSSRGSSRPRDQTCISCVSCTGRQILYHWATREAHTHSWPWNKSGMRVHPDSVKEASLPGMSTSHLHRTPRFWEKLWSLDQEPFLQPTPHRTVLSALLSAVPCYFSITGHHFYFYFLWSKGCPTMGNKNYFELALWLYPIFN